MPKRESAKGARTTRVLLGLLVLVLLGFGWLLWRGHWSRMVVPAPQRADASGQAPLPFEVLEEVPTVEGVCGAAEPVATPRDSGGDTPSAEQDSKRYLRLLFQTEDGEAIGGVPFLASRVVDEELMPGTQALRCNHEGAISLAMALDTTSVQVQVNDMGWHIDIQIIHLDGPITQHTLKLHRLVSVEFDVRYEDGLPFKGRASFGGTGDALPARYAGGSSRGEGWVRRWRGTAESNPFTIDGISPRDAVLNFYCERAGYDRFDYEIKKEQLYEGARIAITITKPKNPPGTIILHFDLSAFPEQWQEWSYSLVPDSFRGSETSSTEQQRPPSEFALHTINPGEYTVTVVCENRVWSARVLVVGSEETHVQVELAEAAAASVCAIDENGEPIQGACLYLDERVHIDYPTTARAGSRALSGRDGIALLSGLPPHVNRLYLEAEGYDQSVIPVVLSSGMTADLGTIRLTPSAGMIEVRLLNASGSRSYEAMCIHPWGRGGRSTLRLVPRDGVLVFEKMKFRDYMVAVRPAHGGRVVSKNITLSGDEPKVVVELDVSSLTETDD